MLKQLLAAATFAAFTSGAACATTYHCKFKDPTQRGVIPSDVLIQIDGNKAVVADPILDYFKQSPKPARKFVNTNTVIRVGWRLENAQFKGGGASTIDYSLVYKKKNHKANLTINVFGYDNREFGTGACALKK